MSTRRFIVAPLQTVVLPDSTDAIAGAEPINSSAPISGLLALLASPSISSVTVATVTPPPSIPQLTKLCKCKSYGDEVMFT